MRTYSLGDTSLEVSELVFGCWGIITDTHWGNRDREASTRSIHAAVDAGINFFDTAEMYGDGNSESLLGAALSGKRDNVLIATKMRPDSMAPADIATACTRSLTRLNTDYIDLYQTHWPDHTIPLTDTWDAMLRLKEQGKVREIGVCNLGTGDLQEIRDLPSPVTNQLPYNLLWRIMENDVFPTCRARHIDVMAYSPLMHGLLSGQFASAADVPDGRARSRHFSTDRKLARHGEVGCERETFAAIDAIREIGKSLGRSMTDVALGWVAANPDVKFVIAGVRTPEQLAQNVATLENPLTEDAVAKLNAVTEELKKTLGPNPDMWESTEHSRFR